MPPKIKQLIYLLEQNGFSYRRGKGSHKNYSHPKCSKIVTMSGKPLEDAWQYQIKQVKEALDEVKSNEERSRPL